ncbi:MAG TPA: HupE/UreJ family protein [Burkholderiaceae bacterium]
MRRLLWALLLSLCMLAPALAHTPSDGHLDLEASGTVLRGQLALALRDLDYALGLDQDGNGELTWDEVRARQAAIDAYVLERLSFANAGPDGNIPCKARIVKRLIDQRSDGAYAVLRLSARCLTSVTTLEIDYKMLFDVDPRHRGLLTLRHDGGASQAVFAPDSAKQAVHVAESSTFGYLLDFIRHGARSLIAWPHLLCVLALLLPALRLKPEQPDAPAPLRAVLGQQAAFAAGYVTLTLLGALAIAGLPYGWLGPLSALSATVLAFDALRPVLGRWRMAAAGAAGVLHGLAFAALLAALGMRVPATATPLACYLLGIALMHVLIVGVFLAQVYALRQRAAMRRRLLQWGAPLICVLALVWLAARVGGITLSF